MENGQRPRLLSGISLRTLRRAYSAPESQLTEKEAASTLFRFFRSKHVIDLRLIVFTVVVLLVFYLITIFIGFIGSFIFYQTFPAQLLVTLTGPAVGIAGLIIGWAYKAASIRLGIIDLFGCEIGTLCRVGTVLDVGTRYVCAYERGADAKDDLAEKRAPFDKYTSQENYFPIFEHNSNDLQLLEALVVRHITEFYTFMKAARDTQRPIICLMILLGREPNAFARASLTDISGLLRSGSDIVAHFKDIGRLQHAI